MIFGLARRWSDEISMTLLIVCILIYHFDLPVWLYAVAGVVRAAELFTAFMNYKNLFDALAHISQR
jgi:beta-glucosidase/6-phospho-beta-glucosidase/beta-galactosidase